MSVFQQMETKAKEISNILDKLLAMNNDELYGEKRLHEISFIEHGKESFLKVFSLIEDLKKSNLNRIPVRFLDPLQNVLNTYLDIFNRAQSLSVKDSSPTEMRDRIVNDIENNYDTLYEQAWPLISFANTVGTDFKSLERDAKKHLEDAKLSSEQEKKKIEQVKSRANKILNDIKLIASESGVETTSFNFSEAESVHKEKAGRNLRFPWKLRSYSSRKIGGVLEVLRHFYQE